MGPEPLGLGGGGSPPPSLRAAGGGGAPRFVSRETWQALAPLLWAAVHPPPLPTPSRRVEPAPGSARFPEHASPRPRGRATWLPQPASRGRAAAPRCSPTWTGAWGAPGARAPPAQLPRSRFSGAATLSPCPGSTAPPWSPWAPRAVLGAGTCARTPCSCPGRGLGDPLTLRPAASPRTCFPCSHSGTFLLLGLWASCTWTLPRPPLHLSTPGLCLAKTLSSPSTHVGPLPAHPT